MTIHSKKIAAVALSLITTLGFATPALANNHRDTEWSFTLTSYDIGRTGPRQKQDDSYTYAKLNKKSDKGQVQVWVERTYQKPDVKSAHIYLSVGQEGRISQYAYEMYGKVQVSLCVQNANKNATRAVVSGLWSPDSV